MKHPMRPRKLYLDTASWIDMAEGRVDSGPFENGSIPGSLSYDVCHERAL